MNASAQPPSKAKRTLIRVGVSLAVVVGLLLVPDCSPAVPTRPDAQAFEWKQDERWTALEARFAAGKTAGCPEGIADELFEITKNAHHLAEAQPGPGDPRWQEVEDDFFALTASLAGCPERTPEFLAVRNVIRRAAKRSSIDWPPNETSRARLYRLLYGTRAAVEEFLLQLPPDMAPSLTGLARVGSATPSAEVEGVRIHSGDLLVSRGGAPTSAFIARGNDFPGNFSHVALVHIDGGTGAVSIIEAHIERGVAVATPKDYFRDKKFRILVLRVRPDHPALRTDPMLPHDAAAASLRDAKTRHIPYDFAMNFDDPVEQFCSEVASANYAQHGIQLWPSLSTFSSVGLARWMAAFGVENLETHSPSDLEYDPALVVVAEWHDREVLFDDHVDNAIIDAMLESAENGANVGHAWWMLPVARTAKGYSWILNLFGGEGPVPEGMSATVALRAQWLAARHAGLEAVVIAKAKTFEQDRGYTPPYWQLVELSREAVLADPS